MFSVSIANFMKELTIHMCSLVHCFNSLFFDWETYLQFHKQLAYIYCCYHFVVPNATDHTPLNQVDGVRVHVYEPQLDNSSIVSAQIIWDALDESTNVISYDVRVRTADASIANVTVS